MASDDDVDRLYGLPPGSFVPERDALAKALRADRRRDEAAAVKALPKPTVAAWTVNQVVRSQVRDARALWAAGDALVAAQAAVVAGEGSGADLRAAAEAERGAVETLVEAARGLLDDRGHELSESTVERVRSTLHAAAIDPEARAAVAAGRAERELEPPALGGFAGAVATPAPARGGRRRGDTSDRRQAEREAAAEARRVERERRALRRRVEQAQAALERARADAEGAQRQLAAAREREDEASTALDEARGALDALS